MKRKRIRGRRSSIYIWVSKEEKSRLRSPWKSSLIIKLKRRTIGYKTLQAKLAELWRLKAALNLGAMDNGFFMVNILIP